MLSLRRILVPTDLSESAHAAFHLAHDLAERHAAEVHVLHVVPLGGTDPLSAFWRRFLETPGTAESIQEAITERIENEVARHGGRYERIHRVHREGAHVAAEILDYAREAAVDLIAMGTHGHRSLDHPALGGTAGDVVRRASCAVLTVREDRAERVLEENRPSPLGHLLVPIDFGDEHQEALRVARELGALYGARLSLLFVAEERQVVLFSDTGLPTFNTLQLDPEVVERAGEALSRLYEDLPGPPAEASFHVRSGHPAHEILDFAEAEGVDLIVMSTDARSAHEHVFFGTIPENVVRKAPCPVLTLKAPGSALLSATPQGPGEPQQPLAP